MTLAAGNKLGPYEIVAPLGAGGMGEVYRAHGPRAGRDVSFKSNCLVMELIERPTPANRIKQGVISSEESLETATQIADSMAPPRRWTWALPNGVAVRNLSGKQRGGLNSRHTAGLSRILTPMAIRYYIFIM
jgi:serine/threonine protein kinase